jgi:hypothetical protein
MAPMMECEHSWDLLADQCTKCGITYEAMWSNVTLAPGYGPNFNTIKCTCGSDAVGSPRHSTWCPKFKADQ